jgi:hypothetical protein
MAHCIERDRLRGHGAGNQDGDLRAGELHDGRRI